MLIDVKRTSERVDRNQDSSNVSVYLCVRPSLLEIIVHAFVADSGQQCHIRHSNLLLLESFLPISLSSSISEYRRIIEDGQTLTNFPFPSGFLEAGIAFFPAFFDGAYSKSWTVTKTTRKWTNHVLEP